MFQLSSSNCAGSFTSINASGLPPGVSASLDSTNDRITPNVTWTTSSYTSQTYNYSISPWFTIVTMDPQYPHLLVVQSQSIQCVQHLDQLHLVMLTRQ